ncbi:hypothetical protein TNCV_1602081, partial [Trichonephila clavipes]
QSVCGEFQNGSRLACVQDASVPNAILVRLWVQTFIQRQDMSDANDPNLHTDGTWPPPNLLKDLKITYSPVEPEKYLSPGLNFAEPRKPPMDEVIPPLSQLRCDKGAGALSPPSHVQRLDLGKGHGTTLEAPKTQEQGTLESSNNTDIFVGA